MAAWTSWATLSMPRSRSNCRVTLLTPDELIEFMEDRPLIWPNCCSRGVVTEEAMTAAEAPGSWVVTWIVGKSTLGRAAIGKRR